VLGNELLYDATTMVLLGADSRTGRDIDQDAAGALVASFRQQIADYPLRWLRGRSSVHWQQNYHLPGTLITVLRRQSRR
jgi:hypothetical protein